MMKKFCSDLTFIAFGVFVLLGFTQSWINTTSKTGERVVGAWKSDSLTRFGTTTVEFREDGTCSFRESGGEQFSCKWIELGHGQLKIAVTEQGKSDVFFAGTIRDHLYVNQPRREPNFIRAESPYAHKRQLLANAPQ